MKRAWLYQNKLQQQRFEAEGRGAACPWSVGYYDPDGHRRSKCVGTQKQAEAFARKIEGQLAADTYQTNSRKTWADFRKEHDATILPRLAADTQRIVSDTLNHFERLAKPGKVRSIRTQTIDEYVSKRQTERGRKPKSKVSPATINRELRHLKATLRVANDWGYLPDVPKFKKVREEQRIGLVIMPEHFYAIMDGCDVAERPHGLHCKPADWWRALLTFAITTGWRIDEILSLRREDVDLTTGAVVTRAGDNKGGRDDVDHLKPSTLDLVRPIVGFKPCVFWWPHGDREIWTEFKRIQKAAGIHLACRDADQHECTDACHYYGFHALRRGYATLNADRPRSCKRRCDTSRSRRHCGTSPWLTRCSRLPKTSGNRNDGQRPPPRAASRRGAFLEY